MTETKQDMGCVADGYFADGALRLEGMYIVENKEEKYKTRVFVRSSSKGEHFYDVKEQVRAAVERNNHYMVQISKERENPISQVRVWEEEHPEHVCLLRVVPETIPDAEKKEQVDKILDKAAKESQDQFAEFMEAVQRIKTSLELQTGMPWQKLEEGFSTTWKRYMGATNSDIVAPDSEKIRAVVMAAFDRRYEQQARYMALIAELDRANAQPVVAAEQESKRQQDPVEEEKEEPATSDPDLFKKIMPRLLPEYYPDGEYTRLCDEMRREYFRDRGGSMYGWIRYTFPNQVLDDEPWTAQAAGAPPPILD